MRTLGKKRRAALVRDLLAAKHDVVDIAEAHRLTLDELADWAREEETRRRLSGLCSLADAQAQLMISRYRLMVAHRLIRHATQEEQLELSRKACVDLLKLHPWPVSAEGAGDEEDDPTAVMRALLAAEEGGDDERE